MDKMEFLDPWNLKEDPWAIRSIKNHRESEKHKGRKELLVVYQSDGEEEWLPYEKVLANEPWLVAQYVNSQKLQFKHGGKRQHIWASKYIRSIEKICRRLCGVSLLEEVVPEEPDIKNRRESCMLKEMHGLPIPKSA